MVDTRLQAEAEDMDTTGMIDLEIARTQMPMSLQAYMTIVIAVICQKTAHMARMRAICMDVEAAIAEVTNTHRSQEPLSSNLGMVAGLPL